MIDGEKIKLIEVPEHLVKSCTDLLGEGIREKMIVRKNKFGIKDDTWSLLVDQDVDIYSMTIVEKVKKKEDYA